MNIHERVSTGLGGFDRVIDSLRLGDNVVWQVDTAADYRKMAEPFAAQAKRDHRKLIYVRFAGHEPILQDSPDIRLYRIEAQKGFESFVAEVYSLVKQEGRKAFYVFDCLTDLLEYWHSDLMIENFFKVTCPFLYELDTVAYFAIMRNIHTYGTIAGIRETTQLLLDLYQVGGKFYIHPLKVLKRYSPTMFFPHLIQEGEAVSITSSADAAELFSGISRGEERLDYWDVIFNRAKEAVHLAPERREAVKRDLMSMLIGEKSRMFELCDRYFTLNDILMIYAREVGTGFIGGKSVGMLLARKILEKDGGNRFTPFLEPHDSYYLGSDLFYTYLVQNGLWKLRMKQKTEGGYFKYAPELKERLLHGRFSETIQEQFLQMLEHFGQSPIIVRSSSLLEDNFGNAFAGKYDSIFCVNQGTPEERYEAFERAIRTVYASTMNEDALSYRISRGLSEKDEQMAILVQRVSGDYHGENFFPHLAGVGNSSNLYVWDKTVDMEAGMLRLVFGLGTRAVDRTVGDYVRIVCLDDPLRTPPTDYDDQQKFSQHFVDVLSLPENALTGKGLEEILSYDIHTDRELFAGQDFRAAARLRELGYSDKKIPHILHFEKLLKTTEFPRFMKDLLALLSNVYNYPVDIEFTANFRTDRSFKVNLLQCRPLQTRGLGKSVEIPALTDERDCFFASEGNFMGGNVHLPIDYVVYVHAPAYLNLSEQNKYMVARQIGMINTALKGKNVLLMGPGRWGTTTPSLGVPVHFSELCNMAVICEVASPTEGLMPELSYGSHFFQDLVETGIFYVAIFNGQKNVVFHPERILEQENILSSILPQSGQFGDAIRIVRTDGMEIFSDILTQRLLCR
ncbi:PEP/pyruvate-binding domain-containing protein [Caproiciproducens sp. CPB-2]|uniref:PEP/pyruvate-binding domain-containing protein n=1 Tax=Caproiciproducens sp. CPB-2 TaxID=3030017 RepID=UPI0023DA38DD|nr:PEP/pyruvate-binding domain-containing protein [Caproiciproducens sp. CPB-2]MDF1494041.1 PEP/pyruvate-binding domain-containing protein [Caproiciproducens sp. CPB-2]